MIPYDDLVLALQTWRARQGLQVAQMSGVAIVPPAAAPPPPPQVPRSNPPAPPRPGQQSWQAEPGLPLAKAAATPPPLAPPPDTRDEDVDDAALLEEAHYENEGDDFAMSFQGGAPPPAEVEDESTSIGTAPPPGARDSFSGGGTEPEQPPKSHNNNDDWVSPDQILVDVEGSQGSAAIGRVLAAGEHAQGLIGKRVLIGPYDPCGECEICRRGGAAVCGTAVRREPPGATLTAAARWAVPLGDGLELPSPIGAAVPGAATLAYTLYARTGPAPREPVVIAGASPAARFLVEILRAKGIGTVIVVVDPALEAWHGWLRARDVATATSADGVTALLAADGQAGKTRRVIATTTNAIDLAASLAGPRSTLTVLAPVAALPGDLVSREVTVISVAGPHPDLVVEVAAMCMKGEIDLAGGTCLAGGIGLDENTDMRAVVVGR